MPTYRLKRFANPQALRSIQPQYLLQLLNPHRDFFQNRGMKLPRPNSSPRLDYSRLVEILATPDDDTPRDLADALFYVHEMSTIEAMNAILAVVSLEQLGAADGLFSIVTPADIAVRLWLYDQRTLERKHAELFATNPRRFEYFQSLKLPAAPFIPPTADQLRPLEEALDKEFYKKLRGRGVRVFCYPHAYDCMFLVRHGEPYRRESVLQGSEESSVMYRPLRFDTVVYDWRTGTLRMHTSSQWETSLYRGQFGLHLFGAIDHFPDKERYTLQPLQTQHRRCLESLDVAGIKMVMLTEVRIRWGGNYKEEAIHRATNLFAAMSQRSWELPKDAPLSSATFTLLFFGSKPQATVTIEPPNVAHYSRDDDSPLIDKWLTARGFIRAAKPEKHEEAEQLLCSA